MASCSCPGCDRPGTNQCSACKSKFYCGLTCQTADWPHHKEECPGHLWKVGMAHIVKANGFYDTNNWPQTLRHADIAATKLKQMKDHPVELLDDALKMKHQALNGLGRNREALECAKEWYCLYPTNHTHPPAIEASFAVIHSCGVCKEYYDACLYARTQWETITLSRDSHIPDNLRDQFTSRGAFELARALYKLAKDGGMPVEEQKETGVETIMLARRSLEITSRLWGAESEAVAVCKTLLGQALDYFNDVDDDEVPRLHEEALVIYRAKGSLSATMAACVKNLGIAYYRRAFRALDINDLNRFVAIMELALPHYREATRIYRAINREDLANETDQQVQGIEHALQRSAAVRAEIEE